MINGNSVVFNRFQECFIVLSYQQKNSYLDLMKAKAKDFYWLSADFSRSKTQFAFYEITIMPRVGAIVTKKKKKFSCSEYV